MSQVGKPAQEVTVTDESPSPGPRADLLTAIRRTPDDVQREIVGPAKACLDLIHLHLPAGEEVLALCPTHARLASSGPHRGLLALTTRRLLFVAPAPQALAWPLTQIDSVMSMSDTIVILPHKVSFEVAAPWGQTFGQLVDLQSTIAVIADS